MLNSSVRIFEIVSLKNPFKPLSPEQLRVKSLKDQIKSKQAALKRERELQKAAKAQRALLRLDKV
jgi:hypothetical protein